MPFNNELLRMLGRRRVTVTRTIIVQGPADVVYRQLNNAGGFLNEDKTVDLPGELFIGELPRVVELVEESCPAAVCHTPTFVELDRFADEGNPHGD